MGEVRKFDSGSDPKLYSVKSRLSEAGITISTDKYISGNYKTPYILRLVSGSLMVAAAAGFVIVIARHGSVPGIGTVAVTIIVIAAMLFMVFTLLFADTV